MVITITDAATDTLGSLARNWVRSESDPGQFCRQAGRDMVSMMAPQGSPADNGSNLGVAGYAPSAGLTVAVAAMAGHVARRKAESKNLILATRPGKRSALGARVFLRGKHKGSTVWHAFNTNPSYFEWLANNGHLNQNAWTHVKDFLEEQLMEKAKMVSDRTYQELVASRESSRQTQANSSSSSHQITAQGPENLETKNESEEDVEIVGEVSQSQPEIEIDRLGGLENCQNQVLVWVQQQALVQHSKLAGTNVGQAAAKASPGNPEME